LSSPTPITGNVKLEIQNPKCASRQKQDSLSKSRLISDALVSAAADSSCGELTEAKHLWFISVWEHRGKIDPRLFSRECGIGMTP
jgi:hypothetical protein